MKKFIWEEWSVRHVGAPVASSYTTTENFGEIEGTSCDVEIEDVCLATKKGTTHYSSPQSEGYEETWTEECEMISVVAVKNGSWIKVYGGGTYRYLLDNWYYDEDGELRMQLVEYPPAEHNGVGEVTKSYKMTEEWAIENDRFPSEEEARKILSEDTEYMWVTKLLPA